MRGSFLVRSIFPALALAAWLVLAGSPVLAQTLDEEARAIARELQCPVCQGLSVADSPSQLAGQMRDLIRTKLAHGEGREEILQYFAHRYGEWVLLSPPRSGFTSVVWVAPYVGLAAAVAFLLWALRRRRPTGEQDASLHDEAERFLPEVDRSLERLRDQPLR